MPQKPPEPFSITGTTYKRRFGVDWDAGMSDELIGLTVGKKHREYKADYGVDFKDPWVPLLDAARSLIPPSLFSVSEWTEQHFHDFVMYTEAITWGCASSGKAQPLDSVVYTPDGPRTMGEIQPGDLVLSADGKPTRVLKTHDAGAQDVYEVRLMDGASTRCAGSHLWRVTQDGGKPRLVCAAWLEDQAASGQFFLPDMVPADFSDTGSSPVLRGSFSERRARLWETLCYSRKTARLEWEVGPCPLASARQLAELAQSLGYRATIAGENTPEAAYTRMSLFPTPKRRIDRVTNTGVSASMKCITVENPTGLYLTDNFIVTHNSNDYGLLILLDWITDPLHTVAIIGSTTKVDLRIRIWEAVIRYHEALKNNDKGFLVPGVASEQGFMISNEKESGGPESQGKKAAILGRALNEDGRLIGAHLPYARIVVDELATISNYGSIDQGIANLSTGAKDFRFFGLANPKAWDDQSCKYCIPKDGQKVDVDTGTWVSTRGVFVRHHDGLKSPAYLHPETEKTFHYLMNRRQVADHLRRNDGNENAPLMWEQVRGFPLSSGAAFVTALDPLVAAERRVTEPMPEPLATGRRRIGLAAGVDPAWTQGGDDAVFQGCEVVEQDGKVFLDFSNRQHKIPINAVSGIPVSQQQRDFVLQRLLADGGPTLDNLAVDSSGNQGLGDVITMQVGPGLLAVNNSNTASDRPMKANDPTPAKTNARDRGTEAAMVLAEFCKAGQVRGLPADALAGLTQRRFVTRPKSTVPVSPFRLEPKEEFRKRFKGSPNGTDAAALAALAVKERLGVMPYGSAPVPVPSGVLPGVYSQPANQPPPTPVPEADYGGSEWGSDGDYAG